MTRWPRDGVSWDGLEMIYPTRSLGFVVVSDAGSSVRQTFLTTTKLYVTESRRHYVPTCYPSCQHSLAASRAETR